MPADLPGNNYNAPVGNKDMRFEQGIYRDEFLERMRLLFGHPDYLTVASWGIVAETDPAASSVSSGPLWVTASTTDLTVSVTPGIAVTKSGHWINLTAEQSTVSMSTVETGGQNVVTIKFSTKDPDERSPNEFGVPMFKRRLEQDDDAKIAVYSMSQWNALSADSQNDHVPLALATITETGGSQSVSVTLVNTTYTWLRPWFSPVDIAHRKMTGSGTVSATNPHGQSFNDLTVGNFTLPQLTSHVGMVVARDVSIGNMPGQVCEVDVPAGLIKTDDVSGSVTGVANTKYIVLDFYPLTVGAVYTQGNQSQQWAFQPQFRGQIIFQPAGSPLVPGSTDVTVLATKCDTLSPPAVSSSGISQTNFVAGSIDANDAVIAAGKVYVSSHSVTLSSDMATDAGPVPMKYRYYFAGGKVVRNPQTIVCATKLTAITGSGIVPSITQFDDGVVLAALDQAAAGASLSVKVKISGTDSDGAAAEETLIFDSNWAQAPAGCSVNSSSFQRGSTVFQSIDTVTLEENLNSGSNAILHLWVVMDPVTATDLSYAAPIANVTWNGSKMCYVEDLRQIHYDLQMPRDADIEGYQSIILHELLAEPAGTRNTTYLESFLRPRLSSLLPINTTNWETSAGGSFIDPGDAAGHDRNLRALERFYESKPLVLSQNAQRVGIVFYPPIFQEWQRNLSVTIYYALQDNTGTWGSFTQLTSSGLKSFDIALPANTRVIQIRVIGAELRGMAVIEYI